MRWWDEEPLFRGRISAFDAEQIAPDADHLWRAFFLEAFVEDVDIALDELHFGARDSDFRNCTFRQKTHRTLPGGTSAQGWFGNGNTRFRNCRFLGVRMLLMGGFSFGEARFEDCLFEILRYGIHFRQRADLIRCIFIGQIDAGRFCGSGSGGPLGSRVNEITAKEFMAAEIGPRVEFSKGFPFAHQRWPEDFKPGRWPGKAWRHR